MTRGTRREPLPPNPPRDNRADHCQRVGDPVADRTHLTRCTCETHDGVCEVCGVKITVGPGGTEYGHARARNRAPGAGREDCPHRPAACDPGRWQGDGETA
jgi:hypothetical protein